VSYDISLKPDFATGVVSGVEYLRFQSLSDGMEALSLTANSLAVNATLDGQAGVAITSEGNRRTFHLPRLLHKDEEATLAMSFAGSPKRDVVFTADEIHTGYFTCEVMFCDVDRPGDRATLRAPRRAAAWKPGAGRRTVPIRAISTVSRRAATHGRTFRVVLPCRFSMPAKRPSACRSCSPIRRA